MSVSDGVMSDHLKNMVKTHRDYPKPQIYQYQSKIATKLKNKKKKQNKQHRF